MARTQKQKGGKECMLMEYGTGSLSSPLPHYKMYHQNTRLVHRVYLQTFVLLLEFLSVGSILSDHFVNL
jgi:hypothetical protein